MRIDRRKLRLAMAAAPIAVEGERSRRTVVDDVVAGIESALTFVEIAGCERALFQSGKYGVVEVDLVPGNTEVGDLIDILRAKIRIEHEGIPATVASQRIGTAAAIDLVGAGVARDFLTELIAGQVDFGLAVGPGGGELLDVRIAR